MPTEILVEIALLLNTLDLVRVRGVSKLFYSIVELSLDREEYREEERAVRKIFPKSTIPAQVTPVAVNLMISAIADKVWRTSIGKCRPYMYYKMHLKKGQPDIWPTLEWEVRRDLVFEVKAIRATYRFLKIKFKKLLYKNYDDFIRFDGQFRILKLDRNFLINAEITS